MSIIVSHRKLWLLLGASVFVAFFILGFFGREVYHQAPPLPDRFVATDGSLTITRDAVLTGQQVWQSTGGQELGSVWGHGAYQAPDWSADWLHREATALLDIWSQREFARPYALLTAEQQGGLRARLTAEMRTNTYDSARGTVTLSADRAEAIRRTAAHFDALFGGVPALAGLRSAYAMQDVVVPDATRRRQLTAFFFWTSWAASTDRPASASAAGASARHGSSADASAGASARQASGVTYTNNWPHEPLIDNRPTAANVLWSITSVVLLLAGIGAFVWWHAFRRKEKPTVRTPPSDPFEGLRVTPSMRAVAKYLAVVAGLFLVQVILGIITAHYTVEGQGFFGIPLSRVLPYAVTRTWHIQTGLFWIATAFLAAGLFLAPAIGGYEPKYQRLGVDVLFGALLIVVLGSLAGEWLSIQQRLPLNASFWFGDQGYEYVDLGRAWQMALFAGLVIWLGLMLRGLKPALGKKDDTRSLILMFAGASTAVGLMYGAGFFFTARTHLSVMEYWRWWVVHLWVEGFFEVFATAAAALIFARLGLVQKSHAGAAVIASSALFLFAGIPGTFHHLYFSGTPTSIMAVGASFSALEVVPLVLVGLEAYQTSSMQRATPWMIKYRWPVRFFVGVAFWNLVGAGLFGFLINPPIALYYMQGLNTTPVHAHTALFGVYGLLALGLTLTVARLMTSTSTWREGVLRFSFRTLNVGLVLMVGISVLPVGIAQAAASVQTGLWYARSADFLQQPWVQTLRWLRMIGDLVFTVGAVSYAWFLAGLWFGWSIEKAPVRESDVERFAPQEVAV